MAAQPEMERRVRPPRTPLLGLCQQVGRTRRTRGPLDHAIRRVEGVRPVEGMHHDPGREPFADVVDRKQGVVGRRDVASRVEPERSPGTRACQGLPLIPSFFVNGVRA
ncbi:MAG: hypothetical protein ACREOC_01310 [Gemmatimonadales bacterium]